MNERVLLVGISTRAAAASAAHAGYTVCAVDAFADLDQHPGVRARRVAQRFGPRAAARTAAKLPGKAVVYLSPFENHPEAIAALTADRVLWGNGPAVVQAVRDPRLVAEAAYRHGCRAPRLDGAGNGRWLMKPLASGGGRGIVEWQSGMRMRKRHYLQEYLDGVLASVAFVANGEEAVVVGITRQLAGIPEFGARAYAYCGTIFDPALLDSGVLEAARRIASVLTAEFRLVGINVVDVMICDGVPYVLEVNPRWSGSIEVLEDVGGVNLFAAHADACTSGRLPTTEPAWALYSRATGKAIVFARLPVTVSDTRGWVHNGTIRDVPRPNMRINAGEPICTVTACACDLTGCLVALKGHAVDIYDALQPTEAPAA